jgi:DNA invertase Pin-like site-specific DNA recombinase
MRDFCAYYRVSTEKQGAAGLGIDAQREAVGRFIAQDNGKLVAEFIEVESGRRHKNRPQLLAALDECKSRKASLLIAKLDRLSRNVAFIARLMEGGVDFVCCDNPHAIPLMLHMMAAFAEHEARVISDRTRVALAAAKARGKKVGNPRWQESIACACAANQHRPPLPDVLDLMLQWRAEALSYDAIARRLNRMKLRTPQGNLWHASSVRNALVRKDAMTTLNPAGTPSRLTAVTP